MLGACLVAGKKYSVSQRCSKGFPRRVLLESFLSVSLTEGSLIESEGIDA